MSTEDFAADDPLVHRDRHQHGGGPDRPDDDELARRTERERVDAGLAAYDPDDVPPATDVEAPLDPAATEEYQEETAEIRRQMSEGEIYPLTDKHPFPPTRYEEQ
jgi:hypothetical protein